MAARYGFIVQQNIQSHDKDETFILVCRYRWTEKTLKKCLACTAGVIFKKKQK